MVYYYSKKPTKMLLILIMTCLNPFTGRFRTGIVTGISELITLACFILNDIKNLKRGRRDDRYTYCYCDSKQHVH